MRLDTTLEEAPTYYPTAEEFADPTAYIASVRREAQRYGACKIVPPKGWRRGSFGLDGAMRFEPRLMPLHKLQQGCGLPERAPPPASLRACVHPLTCNGHGARTCRCGFQMAPPTSLREFKALADGMQAAWCAKHGVASPLQGKVDEQLWEALGGRGGHPAAAGDAGGAEPMEVEAAPMEVEAASGAAAPAETAGGGGGGGGGGGEAEAAAAEEERMEAVRRTEEELERCFWRLVRTESEPLIVPYGADLDAATHATGFPRGQGGQWNLNKLATVSGSLLDESVDVPGVSSPWLYIGGLFSAFCWHTEDLWMYSCNHLHAGATKTWYVVPATAATKFEKATRSLLPTVFKDAPDLLYQLVAMVAPADLAAQVTQRWTLTPLTLDPRPLALNS